MVVLGLGLCFDVCVVCADKLVAIDAKCGGATSRAIRLSNSAPVLASALFDDTGWPAGKGWSPSDHQD